MPRTGGVFSLLSGSKGSPNTPIQSAPYNSQLDDFAQDANLARPITAGGTGATTASGARTNLGVVVGSDVQAYDAGLLSIAGLTTAANQMIYTTALDVYAATALTPFARTILDDADAATVRTTLGLGSLSTLSAVSDANWSGADLSIANGGTGASTATAARTALGAQAQSASLDSIAGLTTAANQIAYATASNTWAVTSLTAFGRTLIDDADAATARATLGLGTMSTQSAGAVAITGGSITGITDLAVANGGTGASTAAGAKTNLGITDDVQAWVNFNGTGTVAVRASRNVSSITDNGVGNYAINFASPLVDGNYAWSGSTGTTNGYVNGGGVSPTASSLTINTQTGTGASAFDADRITVIVTR